MFREKRRDGTTVLTGARNTTKPLDAYPVGAVYISVLATSPATIFGGTWARLAQGRMLVGVNESDTDFSAARKIGGEKKHQLTEAEMPKHDHAPGTLDMNTTGGHQHPVNRRANVGTGGGVAFGGGTIQADLDVGSAGAHKHILEGLTAEAGGDVAHENMSPFFTVYMWERTA